MEAEDTLIKYGDWNPVLHPRTGTPPIPGWFAPTDGSGTESSSIRTAQNDDPTQRSDVSSGAGDDWVRLPSGPQRIDELADFVEWIANAKPEDEQAIRAEIKRYFYDVGDQGSANALNSALTALLRPGITAEDRQKLLNSLDVFTRADPPSTLGTREGDALGSIVRGSPTSRGRRDRNRRCAIAEHGNSAGPPAEIISVNNSAPIYPSHSEP